MCFIELTDASDGKILININAISSISKGAYDNCTVGLNSEEYYTVEESYEEVKEKIQHANVYKVETREEARRF